MKTLKLPTKSLKTGQDKTIIDPSLLFGRVSLERKTNIPDYFGYEQTTLPTSFFKDNLMRKPNKATLTNASSLKYAASNSSEQMN